MSGSGVEQAAIKAAQADAGKSRHRYREDIAKFRHLVDIWLAGTIGGGGVWLKPGGCPLTARFDRKIGPQPMTAGQFHEAPEDPPVELGRSGGSGTSSISWPGAAGRLEYPANLPRCAGHWPVPWCPTAIAAAAGADRPSAPVAAGKAGRHRSAGPGPRGQADAATRLGGFSAPGPACWWSGWAPFSRS